jgi:hypothetical protein
VSAAACAGDGSTAGIGVGGGGWKSGTSRRRDRCISFGSSLGALTASVVLTTASVVRVGSSPLTVWDPARELALAAAPARARAPASAAAAAADSAVGRASWPFQGTGEAPGAELVDLSFVGTRHGPDRGLSPMLLLHPLAAWHRFAWPGRA